MRRDRSSDTAVMVAALRALATTVDDPLIDDPYAVRFLPGAWISVIGLSRRSSWLRRALRLGVHVVSPGRFEHIALRTRVIDGLVSETAARGVRQLVLLGAGFDTRGYRLRSLAGCDVLEVDHPATQARKRRLLGDLAPLGARHVFVSLDFERERLAAALHAAGFDAGQPALFVWEGVTMYLARAVIARTLAELRELAAPGSAIVMTYMDDSGASGPPSRSTRALAAAVGERFRSALSPAEARVAVEQHGFLVTSDSGFCDWGQVHGVRPRGRTQERILFGNVPAADGAGAALPRPNSGQIGPPAAGSHPG